MSIHDTQAWHALSRPSPSREDFNNQLGCHLEEVHKMLSSLGVASDTRREFVWVNLLESIKGASIMLKSGVMVAHAPDRNALLCSLANQIVSSVGVGYCVKLDVPSALEEVNRSNFSGFVDGRPIRDEDGKVTKGHNYIPPNLEGMY